jgi:hypothetical protein
LVARRDEHAVVRLDHAGHVRRAEDELWRVAGRERRVAAAFVLRQDEDLRPALLRTVRTSRPCPHNPTPDRARLGWR